VITFRRKRIVLRERFLPLESTENIDVQGTLVHFLADHIGVLSSSEYIPSSACMAKNSEKKFIAGLVAKRQKGRL
jgi:hypothetical protein